MSTRAAELAQSIHDAVNRTRRAQGLGSLGFDAALAAVATEHSVNMARHQFFSHTSVVPGKATLEQRVAASGRDYTGIGENLAALNGAALTGEDFVRGWLGSPGHRRNMLTPDWEVAGIGVAITARNEVYATQVFGVPGCADMEPPEVRSVPDAQLRLVVDVGADRRTDAGLFLRNALVAQGTVAPGHPITLEACVSWQPGMHHLAIGYRKTGSKTGWIGGPDGVVTIGTGREEIRWQANESSGGPVQLAELRYARVQGHSYDVSLRGVSRRPLTVYLNGVARQSLAANERFRVQFTAKTGDGLQKLDLGTAISAERYRVHKQFAFDANRGRFLAAGGASRGST